MPIAETISIVLPCFNEADNIEYILSELLAECETLGLQDPQIIFIDDGSIDSSLQVAKSYENRGIRIVNQVNKGLASARNTGIMWATGDVVLPLDSDDMLLENCVNKIIVVIKNNPDVDVVAPSFKEFGKSNREVVLMSSPTIEDFKTANRIGYCSAIKREALLEVGGYNPKMIWGYEDYDLWFDLLKHDKIIVTIPEILWLYRVREGSMITESIKHHDELMNQISTNHPEIYK